MEVAALESEDDNWMLVCLTAMVLPDTSLGCWLWCVASDDLFCLLASRESHGLCSWLLVELSLIYSVPGIPVSEYHPRLSHFAGARQALCNGRNERQALAAVICHWMLGWVGDKLLM